MSYALLRRASTLAVCRLYHTLVDRDYERSYAQEGEDVLLMRLLGERKEPGFYVDVGAYHPRRYSNTYAFYRQGWRGVCIDPTPGSMARWRKVRPRDDFYEVSVGTQTWPRWLYTFQEGALNTCDERLAMCYVRKGHAFTGQVAVPTAPLANLLRGVDVPITIMSVDVEGQELEVLRSYDWRLRPEYLLVECLDTSTVTEALASEVAQFLYGLSYALVAKTKNTLFWQDVTQWPK